MKVPFLSSGRVFWSWCVTALRVLREIREALTFPSVDVHKIFLGSFFPEQQLEQEDKLGEKLLGQKESWFSFLRALRKGWRMKKTVIEKILSPGFPNKADVISFLIFLQAYILDFEIYWDVNILSGLVQGSPTPDLWTGAGLWPVRKRSTQVAGKQVKLPLQMQRI